MWIAIVRDVSPTINRCELAFLDREEIDVARAVEQHRRYQDCLRELGVRVIELPAESPYPDAVFVEDPVVVVNEAAVMTRPGAESRRGEAASLARAIEPYRPLRWTREPATLDGGDVLRMGRTIFVGQSARTNAAGIAQLSVELEPFGYRVQPVPVHGCLHLKSGVCSLGEETVLINRAWVDAEPFRGMTLVDVPASEPWAADVLTLGRTVIMPDCFPQTRGMIDRLGWDVRPVDVSEFMKAEGAVTCLSVVFEI
jgi:dimethylargininase